MNIPNAFLGLAVLTSPLWLMVIIVAVGLVISILLARRIARGVGRVAVGIFVFLLLVCLPFADEIGGQIYFSRLCANEAGARTYDSLRLPAEFWNQDGKPKFLKSNGDLDRALVGDRVREPAIRTTRVSALGIDEYRHQVVDAVDERLLGEVVTFMHWGGWIARNLTTHPSAESCQRDRGAEFWRGFYSGLFVRPETSEKGH